MERTSVFLTLAMLATIGSAFAQEKAITDKTVVDAASREAFTKKLRDIMEKKDKKAFEALVYWKGVPKELRDIELLFITPAMGLKIAKIKIVNDVPCRRNSHTTFKGRELTYNLKELYWVVMEFELGKDNKLPALTRLGFGLGVVDGRLVIPARIYKPLAAEKKAKEPSSAQIQQWVKQLGDDDFKVREEATRDLIKAGESAIEAVTNVTKSEDVEVKQRALKIIKEIGKPSEKAAIAYFKKLGGHVMVDEKKPGKPMIALAFQGTKITDTGLVHLKGLTSLRNLVLIDTKVSDAGLVHLKGLTNLQSLILEGSKITDAGLVDLKGLTSLRRLFLNRTKVTQTGIEKLKKALPNCIIIWDGK